MDYRYNYFSIKIITKYNYLILKLIITSHFQDDNKFAIQGVPKKVTNRRKKIITKIEHCGVKFYHEYDVGGLDLA